MLMLITSSNTIMTKRLFVDDREVMFIGSDSEDIKAPINIRLISAASMLTAIPSIKNGHLMELSGAPTSSIISISCLLFQIDRYIAFIMMRKLATIKISIIVSIRF